MIQALREQQIQDGGQLQSLDDGQSLINTYNNDEAALQAVEQSVALCDRSHWGRIEISDRDRQSFLHNQSTNEIKTLQPGQGCETVIVTSTARTLDLVTVYCLEDSLLLLTSPNRRAQLLSWLDRYIFFQDKVKLTDLSAQTGTFSLIGPESEALLQHLGWTLPTQAHHHTVHLFGSQEVRVAKGSGLASAGYTLIFEADIAGSLWRSLREAGAAPLGESGWEQLRIQQGRPKADAELTEDYNPLEAGLWHTVSLNKGCYIGQETLARLNTYDGVKQRLWGLVLADPVEPGTSILVEDKKVGVITSVASRGDQAVSLGYVKTKAGEAGTLVQIGSATAKLIEVPFLTRSISTSS
ncbi:CAF17-like 4Fe-4S cluster assembly/insertion protein YgfZ [Lyngbya confervoides]|uniref:Folate-binding protein n=1 Tax=Lyngbya confervoides BDU141951 TaxID=1574623 RepID=A0ABD4T4I7_9CYAN|nr:folate-binding protein YgfZ [Lyngbya confervoides]MCM1983736.1 folate-binding protein [Lyngbya confervoides BDU141951]